MTRDEAKAVLELWRPGGQDAEDPRFREALNIVENDAELARWFAAQKALDMAMATHVQATPVPQDLKASILAQQKSARKPFWQIDLVPLLQRPVLRWALAAGFVALLVVGGWLSLRVPHFADYRREVVEAAWDANPHVDLRVSDLAQVRQWVAQQGVKWKLTVPSALLRDTKIVGCSVVKWHDRDVVRLCLLDGPRHQHLFVTDQLDFQDPPWAALPDYENCGRWTTAAWSQGGRTYVLAGMKYSVFTKRYYRSGQWRHSI
jgi:hypothetical protein